MDECTQARAEIAARLLLQSFQEERAVSTNETIPLDELVAWLGLHIGTFHPDDYPQGTYGFIDADEDEHLIWLRRDLPEPLRRFTLAHELGHAIFHCRGSDRIQTLMSKVDAPQQAMTGRLSRKDPCHDTDIQTDYTDQAQFQEYQTYDPRSQRERAANMFAAALLMPLTRIHTLYLQERVPPNTLANIFSVSTAAMLNRLTGLLTGDASLTKVPCNDGTQRSTPPKKKQYDDFQQAAIEAPTPALIVAGPGSGKTSTLIGRTEYIIRVLGVSPDHVLALTFSRKAAQEMEERLQHVLADDSLPKVSTFHAFCADLLRQYGGRVGLRPAFTLLDEAEGYFLLLQQANEMQLHHYQKLQNPTYYFSDLLKAISRAKDELVSPEQYAQLAQKMQEQAIDEDALQKAEKAAEVAHVYALYQQALQQRGDTDFGGLLMLTVQLFREHPEVLREQQQRYQHVLVDEFQDVNRASGVLLRELAGEEQRVWVVGDANQAIYGFRGASPANISQFTKDFPGAVVLPLSRNYRSRPDLVSMAESFRCVQLELGEEPGKNQPVQLTQPDTSVTLAKATNEASELAGLVQDIHNKHAHGYTYKDMVVLCRTRAQVQKISRGLANAGLPVIERGGMLEQEYIKDVLSIALLLIDPSGMGILRSSRQPEHPLAQCDTEAVLLAARETSARTLIFQSEAPADVSVQGQHSLLRLAEIVRVLRYAPDVWSLLAQYLFIETSLVRDLLCSPASKQKSAILADYDRLLQLARHYGQQHPIRSTSSESEHTEFSLEEQIKGFLEYLSLLVLLRQDGGNRQQENADEEHANIIHVMTVHASKGLEFPIVYMPSIVQRRFPLQARSSPVTPPIGMLPEECEGKTAHEIGESCLFYVGVTRARDHIVLSYSERYGKQNYKRSLYLDALEAGLPDERITRLHWESDTEETGSEEKSCSEQPSTDFINAMKPATLSASAIEAYQRCPRQYAYSNIYHFAADADGYQLFWQATQKTIEALRERMQEGGEVQQQELQELYTQHWHAVGGDNTPFATMYERHGHEVVQYELMTHNGVTWEIRPKFNVDVADKTVHVTVDRVEESVTFVRTRFGKRKDKPAAGVRELFYTLAYRQHHPGRNVELHSHNMSTGERVPITMTPRKEQNLYDEVKQSIQAMERNEYPAHPAEPFRCPTCPFFLICPA